jgi:phage repressor protein C with HTH and peptisase S24 domain
MLSSVDIWSGIDALAARFRKSPSGLAKLAGLDPTSFNRSKRLSADTPPRERWPSTESLSKVLAATGVGFCEFASLVDPAGARPWRGVPLLGFAQAGDLGFFGEDGLPVGQDWDEVDPPGAGDNVYALEISGDSMLPVYRAGDRIIVQPTPEPRRGDRVVVKTLEGEVMAKETVRITASRLELASLNPDYPGRVLERKDIAWIARILWASQ